MNENVARRFGPASILLHWVSVPVVLLAFAFGVATAHGGGDYLWRMDVHQTLGTAVFALAVFRLAARLRGPRPGVDRVLGPVERWVATAGEWLMYLLLVAQPVLGWLAANAAGLPPEIAGIVLRAPVSAEPGPAANLRDLHMVCGYTLIGVAAAHVSAVLYHAVVRRDGVLRRMLPERFADRRGA